MAQGKYRRRKKKKVNLVPIFCITAIVVAICLIGTALVLDSRSPEEETLGSTYGTLPPLPTTTGAPVLPTLPPLPTTDPTVETTEATTAPTEETTVPTEPENSFGDKVADLARAQLGKPYMLGGTGPDGFDTSGFIYFCFREYGVSVPRMVSDQAAYGKAVEKEDLQPGDVVFFWTDAEAEVKKAEYPGIYVGGGKFVAARNPEKPVSELDLTGPYFTERYVCARRYG